MQSRATQTEVKFKGKKIILPANTIILSVYNTGLTCLSRKETRTFINKAIGSGYITTKSCNKYTLITLLYSPIYNANSSKTATRKPRNNKTDLQKINTEFEYIENKILNR